jgi:hypothetical protein
MWNDTDTPLAYFISFRTRATWLHGDERGSIDRFHNRYGTRYIPPDPLWHRHNQRQLKSAPLILRASQRGATSRIGSHSLQGKRDRQLREDRLWLNDFTPWARKGNKIKLWNEQSVARAIDYVLDGQGDDYRIFRVVLKDFIREEISGLTGFTGFTRL